MDTKARLREVHIQVFQGSKSKGSQRDISFDGEKIRCGGAIIKVSPSECRGRADSGASYRSRYRLLKKKAFVEASRTSSHLFQYELPLYHFPYYHLRSKPSRNVTRKTGWFALLLAVTALIFLSQPHRERRSTPDTFWRRSKGRMTHCSEAAVGMAEVRQRVSHLLIGLGVWGRLL